MLSRLRGLHRSIGITEITESSLGAFHNIKECILCQRVLFVQSPEIITWLIDKLHAPGMSHKCASVFFIIQNPFRLKCI